MQKTLQDLHISHERNESENIPILVEERGDAFRGIPKLRRLSLLEYLLGVPWASPSLSSCLSSFSSHRDLLDLRTLHPHKTQSKTQQNWHWALDQYVSPKNSIKSCQKYVKVVEYWHGTIKNYRYDGDVSASPSLIPARPRVGKW